MPAGGPDHRTAARLAEEAGALLLEVRAAGAGIPPRELGSRGDRASHQHLMEALHSAHPHDAVLSEEAADDSARLNAARVWIIDPLDGTREFGEGDRWDWAVHVALWEHDDITAAAVALPARGIVLSTEDPPASTEDGPERLRIVVSRTRPPWVAEQLAERTGAELVPMGSAGAKTAAVLLGEADAYVHAGGQYQWDSAAPVGVALAAGLHATRIDGSRLAYNRPETMLPDLLVCRAAVASRLRTALDQLL